MASGPHDPSTSPEASRDADRLLVIFAPGLWPFRSALDGVGWLLTQGMAAALSELPGLVAYATPRSLVRPEPDVRLPRSLPPDEVVVDECRQLGAEWALTWRVLEDLEGLEIWLNLIDGATGSLLWTQRRTPARQQLVWFLTGALRRLSRQMGFRRVEVLEAELIAPTSSFGALTAYVRADAAHRRADGDAKERGFDIVRDASRAAALDHGFAEACELALEVGLPLVASFNDPLDVKRLRQSVVGAPSLEPARKLRQAAHQRLLALAKRSEQT